MFVVDQNRHILYQKDKTLVRLTSFKGITDAQGKKMDFDSFGGTSQRIKVELGLAKGRAKGDRRAADREKEARKRIREASY